MMEKMKRRSALAALGAVTFGVATPGLLKAEILAKPYEVKNQSLETDILVVGGGTAGVIAAIQAGRAGRKTILVENGSMLGGTTTTGGVSFPGIFHAWGKQVIAGIGWELVKDTVALNDDKLPDFSVPHGRQHWRHQVDVNGPLYAILAEEKCIEAGVNIRYYESPVEASFRKNKWTIVTFGKGIKTEIVCSQVIDCTGNAAVASIARFELLREAVTQPGTLMFVLGGYDYKTLDAKMINERYKAEVAKGDLKKGEFNNIVSMLRKAGNNAQHIAGADSSTSETHTRTNIDGRTSLIKTVRFLRTLPGLEKLKILDMQNETAVRETYRIRGEYQVTHEDYITGKKFADALSYSYYPIDLHDENGVAPKQLQEGIVPTIPLSALIPKGSKNFLVAGRCVSSDRLANSAMRVQGSCMGMGQAAAAAAVVASQQGKSPAEVDIKDIRKLLEEHGAVVPKV